MTVLTLRNLAVQRGRRQVLAPVDTVLPTADMIGVIGPNGAGKSTLLQAISGLLPHTGHWQLGDRTPAREEIGFLPQAYAVKASLTVEECVLLGRREGLGWRVPPGARHAADAVLARCGIAHLAGERMDRLSGGQQQLALIAQRLYRAPRLLILDEPTSALDLGHQIEVLTLLGDHAAATGTTILLALHDLTLAARFCRSLILLSDGRLRAAGMAGAVLSEPAIRASYRVAPEFLTSRSGHKVVVPHRLM